MSSSPAMRRPGGLAGRDGVVEDADTPPKISDYVFKDGLRFVRPYFFDFKLHVKKRMEGKTIVQLFADEFPARNTEYYLEAFKDGRLRVEGNKDVAITMPLQSGTCLRHFIHRHEPPVSAAAVQVVGSTPALVAVNKPACLPVHTVGQYRKNTLIHILQAEQPHLWPLYPTHRLDNPVSGLLVFAKSAEAANDLRRQLEDCNLEKVYVARVQGVFPDQELTVDAPLTWDAKSNYAAVGGSAAGGSAGARPSVTEFRRLFVAQDGHTSVVECRPKTGRTHQIRVHLQHTGHPIANDTQYGGQYGRPLPNFRNKHHLPSRNRCGAKHSCLPGASSSVSVPVTVAATQAAPAARPVAHGLGASSKAQHGCALVDSSAFGSALTAAAQDEGISVAHQSHQPPGEDQKYKVEPEDYDPLCMNCPALPPPDYPLQLEALWLHARSYSGDEWQFEAPVPPWAQEDFTCQVPVPASI